MIKVFGRTFRVPVQNNKAVGKVIEQTTPVMPSNKDRGNQREDKKLVYTHFLSIPIDSPQIRQNYDVLKKQVTLAKVTGVSEQCWQRQSQHHITVLMLDLSDPAKLEAARNILQSLDREIQQDILGASEGVDPQPINLTFKGLRTFQKDLRLTRIVYCDVVKDHNYDLLSRISSLLISTFLSQQVIKESELSHIYIDKKSGLYRPQFHLTVLRAGSKPIDGSMLFQQFGEFELGTVQVGKLQLSNRAELQDSKQRMKRELWSQIKDHEATYACDGEIYLSYDTMF